MPTVVDLKKKCKELKIKGYSKLKKAQLEKLLSQHQQKKQHKVIPSPMKPQKKQEKEPILEKKRQ